VELNAVRHIRKMRGGAHAHLMLADDGHLYVVKFMNNPQHLRVLANERMASQICQSLGLTVPQHAVIRVSRSLVASAPELVVLQQHGEVACMHGRHFASRHIGGLMPGHTVDHLFSEDFRRVRNLEEFAGMAVVDAWLFNTDHRQAVFSRRAVETRYTAYFIDFGYCFGGPRWVVHGSLAPFSPSGGCRGSGGIRMVALEPWVTRVEALNEDDIRYASSSVPPEWIDSEAEWAALIEEVIDRRASVREVLGREVALGWVPNPRWDLLMNRPQPVLAMAGRV